MSTFPRTPAGAYRDLRRRYFTDSVPERIAIRLVENKGEGAFLDARCELGAVTQEPDGSWVMELDVLLTNWPVLMYLVIAHEMVHIKIGMEERHGSKAWNREARRLQGAGLMRRVF